MKRKKYTAFFAVMASAVIFLGLGLTASAEGSKDLISTAEKKGYRPYLEWNSATNLGMHRKNIVYVYAQKGETIYFGSSCYAEDESSVKAVFSDDPDEVTASFTDYVNTEKGIGVAVMIPDTDGMPNSPDSTTVSVIDPNTNLDDPNTVYLFSIDGNGKGHIANTAQETAGPNVDGSDSGGYKPLSFTAPTTGTYAFRFLSKNYSSEDVSQASLLGTENNLEEGNGTIAAFDISVYNNNNEPQTGRVWNDVLFLNTGDNEANIYSSFYVLTDDGFQYKVDTNGMQPYGVVFYSNRRGFLIDPGNSYTNSIETDSPDYNNLQPLMHSFFSREGNTANVGLPPKVNGSTVYANYTPTDPNVDKNNKLFFNVPSSEALEAYTGKNRLTDSNDIESDSSIAVERALTYTGNGPNTNNPGSDNSLGGGTESYGGTFRLELDSQENLPDDFAVILDFSKYKLDSNLNPVLNSSGEWETATDPTANESANILSLIGHKTTENGKAVYTVIWDGRDTYNNIVPPGTYTSIVREYFVYGSMHLPLIDVEGMPNGIKIELMNNISYNNNWFGSRDKHTVYYNNDNTDGTYGTYNGSPAQIGDEVNASTGTDSTNGALKYNFDHAQYTALDIWSDYFYPVGNAYSIEVLPIGEVSGPYLSYVKESEDTNADDTTFDSSHIKTPNGIVQNQGYGSSEDSDINYGNTISTGFVASIKTESGTALPSNDFLWVINIPEPEGENTALYLKADDGSTGGTFSRGNANIEKNFNLGNAVVKDSESVDVNKGNIYKVESFEDSGSAMLLLLDSFPKTTIFSGGGDIDYGIVIDNIYAPNASAELRIVDDNATYSVDIREDDTDNIHSNRENEYEDSQDNSYNNAGSAEQ